MLANQTQHPARSSVADVLHRFLPAFQAGPDRLCRAVYRAIRSINRCRTPELGGSRYDCQQCGRRHFAFHSCNHKACPRCGRAQTAQWVERELSKRVNAPYFLVTMTVPEAVRPLFFGRQAKKGYDLFFNAAAQALAQKLEEAKGLRAQVSGFTAVLHTWGQRMQFHPHIHFLVPGVGINAQGSVVRVRSEKMLVHHRKLSGAWRAHFKTGLATLGWEVDPAVWRCKGWGVHIEHVGDGANALRYLGRYVMRSVIDDRRIVGCTKQHVTIRWCDRSDQNRSKTLTMTGVDFVRRYLRHVLPVGLRSIRYYGFCHPAAKRNRNKIKLRTGMAIRVSSRVLPPSPAPPPACPQCKKPMQLTKRFKPLRTAWRSRGPPQSQPKSQAA